MLGAARAITRRINHLHRARAPPSNRRVLPPHTIGLDHAAPHTSRWRWSRSSLVTLSTSCAAALTSESADTAARLHRSPAEVNAPGAVSAAAAVPSLQERRDRRDIQVWAREGAATARGAYVRAARGHKQTTNYLSIYGVLRRSMMRTFNRHQRVAAFGFQVNRLHLDWWIDCFKKRLFTSIPRPAHLHWFHSAAVTVGYAGATFKQQPAQNETVTTVTFVLWPLTWRPRQSDA